MRYRRFGFCILPGLGPFLGLCCVVGCVREDPDYRWMRGVGKQLDRIATRVEEYGTISVSSPVLAAPSETFAFNLNRDANDYFREARDQIHGQAALFTQEAVDTQLGIRAKVDIAELMKSLSDLSAYRSELAAFERKQALQGFAAYSQGLQPLVEALEPNAASASPLARLTKALSQSATVATQGLPGGDSRPEFPKLGGDTKAAASQGGGDDVLPTTRPAQRVLATEKFKDFMQLLGGKSSAVMSNRAAIITAAGDKATEAMLRFLSNPAEAAKFKDKVVLFGVSMVTVNPGHRTYQGYAADITVKVDFRYKRIRPLLREQLKNCGDSNAAEMLRFVENANDPNRPAWRRLEHKKWWLVDPDKPLTPLVSAISPMTETQALDLQSSFRKQEAYAIQIALALSGLGLDAQAKFFRDWVKRVEQDVATRSAINSVTAYSNSGGIFGFQITPRLKALTDPSSTKTRPGMVLDPLSFPVLFILGIDHDDLLKIKRDEADHLELSEPSLELWQSTRWIPVGNPDCDRVLFGRWWDRMWKPRVGEERRAEWAGTFLKSMQESEAREHDWRHRDRIRRVSKDALDKLRDMQYRRDSNAVASLLEDLGVLRNKLEDLGDSDKYPPTKVEKRCGCCRSPRNRPVSDTELANKVMYELTTFIDGNSRTDAKIDETRERIIAILDDDERTYYPEERKEAWTYTNNRIRMIRQFALDSWHEQALPERVFVREPGAPLVTDVIPARIEIARDGKTKPIVWLLGRNLRLLSEQGEKYRSPIFSVKDVAAAHAGREGEILCLRFEPNEVLTKPRSVVFQLPFADMDGSQAYIPSPAIELCPESLREPKITHVVPLHSEPGGKVRIVLVGEYLDSVQRAAGQPNGLPTTTTAILPSIPVIDVVGNTGVVTDARLAEGTIQFVFEPKAGTTRHAFRLSFSGASGGKTEIVTEPIVLVLDPTVHRIQRSVSRNGRDVRDRVEYTGGVDPNTVQVFLRPEQKELSPKDPNAVNKK